MGRGERGETRWGAVGPPRWGAMEGYPPQWDAVGAVGRVERRERGGVRWVNVNGIELYW